MLRSIIELSATVVARLTVGLTTRLAAVLTTILATSLAAAVITPILLTAPAAAQDLRPYKHPNLDLQFTASGGWHHEPRPGDEQTHERVDPETKIHVLMWRTSTEQSAERYLWKMSHMMDLGPDLQQQPQTIDGRAAWVLSATATVEGTAAQTLLAVIPSGKSRRHPFAENLYIVQIWCPREDGPRLAGRMAELLGSVRITDRLILGGCVHRLYPETTASPADLPSPFVTEDGEVYVTVRTRDGRYGLVPVTVENGAPNDYGQGEWDKGRQLAVDADDFPTLARTGLHAEKELSHTATITGRPVADITAEARPEQASRTGFVAQDEDVLSVIRGDNRLVTRLELTHRQLARPLFEVFNLILRDLELYRREVFGPNNIATVLYSGHEIHIEASGGKGWQQSIFADEVQGYWEIKIWRQPTYGEERYLRDRYGHLPQEQLAELVEMLTSIHTGEMVPFYIQRYGFYEGHTSYRADPITITNLFGLSTIEEIDAVADGDLYGALTRHHTPDSLDD